MEIDRTVVAFFALFLLVYFLESIGGFYMTSAIVSIERQFQIPSKVSGLMVSAGDFGYIPSVAFVSYLGGKGNRARWIGGGCVAIACANLIVSSSNFLFPVETISLNSTVLAKHIEHDTRRLKPEDANLAEFLLTLTPEMRASVQRKLSVVTPSLAALSANNDYAWLENFAYCGVLEARNETDAECQAFYEFLSKRNAPTSADIDNLRLMSTTSYAFCDATLNLHLRSMIERIRCSRKISYIGPTATIFFGLLLLGVGRTMPFSLGLPLMDDNVKKQNLPIYFAGMFFIRIMGPVIGFMMGSFFNKFYYTSTPPQGITPKDPMWIGMWWGGFLVIGIVLFGPSLALFFFRAPDNEFDANSEMDANENIKLSEREKIANDTLSTKESGHELLLVEKSPNGAPDIVRRVSQGEHGECAKKAPVKKKQQARTKLALVDRHAERHADGRTVIPETMSEKARDFFSTISGVVRQPIYAGCLAGRIIDVLAFKGFYIFLPKYLEIQFGIPQYKINMYMGIIGVVGFALGVMAGSIVLRVFKLEGRRVAAWVAICSGIAACLSFANAYVGCHSTLTSLGESIPNNFNINSSCLAGCGCDGVPLYPVCDQRGRVYYSPCHAGCRLDETFTRKKAEDLFDTRTSPVFIGCKCTEPATLPYVPLATGEQSNTNPSNSEMLPAKLSTNVSRDFCMDSDCNQKVVMYFANMAAGGIIGGMGVIPGILIMLRSVPPKHRSVSLGFNGFLVSLLATLPSPIIWGAIIDHFCIYWDKKCDGRGACSLYATDQLRVWLHCIYGSLRLVALITDIYVIFHAKDLKIAHAFGAENDDEEKNEKSAKSFAEDELNDAEKMAKNPENGELKNVSEDTENTSENGEIKNMDLVKSSFTDNMEDKGRHKNIESEKESEENKDNEIHGRKPPLEKPMTVRKHSRNHSRDLRNSHDYDSPRSEDLRKSSTHIAGPISEF